MAKQPGFWDVEERSEEIFGGRRSAGDAGRGGGFRAVPADPRAGRREAAGPEGRPPGLGCRAGVQDARASEPPRAVACRDRGDGARNGRAGCVSAGSSCATRHRTRTRSGTSARRRVKADALDKLFRELDRAINEAGCTPRSCQIVDASLVAAPRQRASAGEKAAIKAGQEAEEIWPGEPAKAAQKDTDARWTVKFRKAKLRPDGAEQVDIATPVFGCKSPHRHRPEARDHPAADRGGRRRP